MHVVLTPAWYPDRARPHNGSFFRHQAQMLRRAGMRVGVLALEPVSFWQAGARLEASVEEGIVVVRGTIPTIPKGALPGDRAIARSVARRAVRLYDEMMEAQARPRAGHQAGHRSGRAAGAGPIAPPQAVHAHSVFAGLHVGALAARHWGAGLVLTEHRPSSLQRARAGWRYRALSRDMRDAVVRSSVSTPFSRRLEEYWGQGPWEDIALPVPQEHFSIPRRPSGGALAFCHVSHLDANKHTPQTLEAFARACRILTAAGHQEPSLTVVGGNEAEVASLRGVARSLGIGHRTVLTGRVAHQEVARRMAAADVLILASGVEAGGTVLAEAQALGCLCVATPTWAGRFMVERASGIVLPERSLSSDEALVAELSRALVEAARGLDGEAPRWSAEQIRRRARERFGEEAFVAASRDIYERAAQGRAGDRRHIG
ncbi:glycosyltransferase [Actinomyces bowdenii]|uniref:glycosyltransferase n=1 Tax=Actinomyces bowdenii TaxID=131109 RepID=UPI00312C810C